MEIFFELEIKAEKLFEYFINSLKNSKICYNNINNNFKKNNTILKQKHEYKYIFSKRMA